MVSAKLRIQTGSDQWAASSNTMSLFLVGVNSWNERTLVYANRPPLSSSLLGTVVASTLNHQYEVSLKTSLIQAATGACSPLPLTPADLTR